MDREQKAAWDAGNTYMESMRAVDEAVFLYDHGMTFTDRSQLQPDDLIFSTSSPKYDLTNDGTMPGIGHVRINIGNGEMIHASGRKRGVVLESAVYSDLSTGKLYGRPLSSLREHLNTSSWKKYSDYLPEGSIRELAQSLRFALSSH